MATNLISISTAQSLYHEEIIIILSVKDEYEYHAIF